MNTLSHILYQISYMGLPLLFAMVLHEYAHGWMAEKCGDPIAKLEGRLTLNPLAHIDPFGTVLMPLLCLMLPGGLLIGWAKPVPIDPRQLSRPRRDMALVAAAGPVMNLFLAVASAAIVALLFAFDPTLSAREGAAGQAEPAAWSRLLAWPVVVMAFYSVLINVVLCLFNLIPLPPLDGGRILVSLLPPQPARALARLEPYGMLILVGLLVFDKDVRVIQTVTGKFATGLSGTILSTALGFGTGAPQ